MRIFIYLLLVSLATLLHAQNLDEFDSISQIDGQLIIKTQTSGVRYIYHVEGSDDYQPIGYGEDVKISPDVRSYLSARHSSIQFQPTDQSNIFNITKANDLRSFGGALEKEEFQLILREDGPLIFTPAEAPEKPDGANSPPDRSLENIPKSQGSSETKPQREKDLPSETSFNTWKIGAGLIVLLSILTSLFVKHSKRKATHKN